MNTPFTEEQRQLILETFPRLWERHYQSRYPRVRDGGVVDEIVQQEPYTMVKVVFGGQKAVGFSKQNPGDDPWVWQRGIEVALSRAIQNLP